MPRIVSRADLSKLNPTFEPGFEEFLKPQLPAPTVTAPKPDAALAAIDKVTRVYEASMKNMDEGQRAMLEEVRIQTEVLRDFIDAARTKTSAEQWNFTVTRNNIGQITDISATRK